jgi:hypothetical protein
MDDQTSSRFQRTAGPVYFLGFLFLALPLMDFVMNVWPLQLGKVNWRYGAFGLAGGFLLTPLLGLVILLASGTIYRHRRVLLVTGILSAITGVALALLSMSFVLDSLQVRSGVPAANKGAFDAGVLKALVKDLTGSVSAAWVALASFRGVGGLPATRRHAASAPLVVGARAEKAG